MKKATYKVKGMHCKACEILIEDKIKEDKNIHSVNADSKKGTAEIEYKDENISIEKFNKSLKELGYELEESDKISTNSESKSNNIKNLKDLLIAFMIFASLYMVVKMLKLDSLFNVNVGEETINFTTVLLVGITAGLSTCMAMVGGLVLGLSSKFNKDNANLSTVKKIQPHLFFNLGRIVGFFFLGGILGMIGSLLHISMSVTAIFTMIVGVIMLLIGLQLLDIFPSISNIKITLPKSVARFFGVKDDKEKKYTNIGAITLGVLTFFIPCGFTQAMQLYAISSGNFLSGALIMSLFAIGTSPALFAIGSLTAFINGKLSGVFFKIAGFAVIFFSLFNINNGYNLSGINFSSGINIPTISSKYYEDIKKSENNADNQVSGEEKIINMTYTNQFDISPSIVNVNLGDTVKINIDVKETASGCMSTIMIPGIYNDAEYLKQGTVELSFKASKKGTFPITCAMGVKRGDLIIK